MQRSAWGAWPDMGKRQKRGASAEPASKPEQPFNNPFAKLRHLVPDLPAAEPSAPAEPVPAQPEAAEVGEPCSVGGKVVLRCERKGHGGKTVTVLSGSVLRGITLAALARALGQRSAAARGSRASASCSRATSDNAPPSFYASMAPVTSPSPSLSAQAPRLCQLLPALPGIPATTEPRYGAGAGNDSV